MKTKLINFNGVDYLHFQLEGFDTPTVLPVITKGSRDKNFAWTWNGDLEKPTLRPSVKSMYFDDNGNELMVHYWLNDGICKCLPDSTDGNANKNLELIEINSKYLLNEK